MSAPPVPPFFEHLGRRPFAFYPAIRNVAHNKWFYRRASWSEILVENSRSHEQIWIPRRYMGEVSREDEPVMAVVLAKELEYHAGRVLPAQRRVIEMPLAVNDGPRFHSTEPAQVKPAAVVGIRVESAAPSRISRVLLGGITLGIAGCLLLVSFYRGGILSNRMISPPVAWDIAPRAADDYAAVVRLLGHPTEERWRSSEGDAQYGLLQYSRRGIYVILRGPTRSAARYIGAMDRNWHPLHAVELPGRGSSYPLLRSLERF